MFERPVVSESGPEVFYGIIEKVLEPVLELSSPYSVRFVLTKLVKTS